MNTTIARFALVVAAITGVFAGGRVSMKVTGGKTASVEMRDGGFCVSSAVLGTTTIHVFAFSANNPEWAVTIRSSKGMPKVGGHVIGPTGDGVGAGLIDKTTGKAPSEWVRYEANAGTITLSRADPTHVAGSFKFSANQSWPAATGAKPVSAEGTFEATVAAGCDDAAKPRK